MFDSEIKLGFVAMVCNLEQFLQNLSGHVVVYIGELNWIITYIYITYSGSAGFRSHPGICLDPMLLTLLIVFALILYTYVQHMVQSNHNFSGTSVFILCVVKIPYANLLCTYKLCVHYIVTCKSVACAHLMILSGHNGCLAWT